MTARIVVTRRLGLAAALLALAGGVAPMRAQSAQGGQSALGGRGGGAASLVAEVRTALGHGSAAEAAALISSSTAPTASRDLATALVDAFQGRDDDAATKLQPLVKSSPYGDAALELALIDLRHGRREEANAILVAITNHQTFPSPEDNVRFARAASARHELLLAGDAIALVAHVPRADVQTEYGDLFMQSHLPGDAALNYKQALSVDAKWVPAHLGLARAYRDDDPGIANKALDTARTLAPDDPDVWIVAADLAMDDERWGDATQALDRFATLRPGTVDEFARRAAMAYAQHRAADIDPALARVRDIDPTSALGARLVGERASQVYHFDEAVAFDRRAVGLDVTDAEAQLELGIALLRAGDEPAARTALDAAWKLDTSNKLTYNELLMLDHLQAFEVVPDGPLVFKFAKDQAPVLKPYALPLGEQALKTFSEHYGITPQGPILVEIFPTHDDFAVRTVGLPGIVGALGACFGRVVSMDSPTATRPPDYFSWQATEWHELAHVFTLQLSKSNVPRWLTEGLSEFEEHRRNPAWGREAALEYAAHLEKGDTFGVMGIAKAFKNPENYTLAYFEASLIVEHLFDLKGDAGLRTLLQSYADGTDDETAFGRAYGETRAQIDASFRQFAIEQYGALAKAMKSPGPIDADNFEATRVLASENPGSYIAQIAYGAALLHAGDDTGAKPVLERAAVLAPQARGDASPHALLAGIALKRGDMVGARHELRAVLAVDYDNVAAARALLKISTTPDASADLDVALRLIADVDPFDATVHSQLGRREVSAHDFASAQIEFEAALALHPTNPAEAHTDLGEVLLALGHKDDAKTQAKLALELAPTFARAQDLLLAAMAR